MDSFEVAVVIVALFTSLLTEAFKSIFDETGFNYKPNILAAIISVVVSVIYVISYVMYFGIAVTNQVIVLGITLVVLSFLCATVGYDKVKQTVDQILKK